MLLLGAFAGVMATVTADTWATELGVLSTHAPRSITTMRPVAPGTSGGVTLLVLLASALGALLIGLILLFGMGLEHGLWLPRLIPAVLLGGLLGKPHLVCTEETSGWGSDDIALTLSTCLLYTSPSPRDRTRSRMPSSA